MLRAYMYKSLRSPLLYIGIIGVIALCCTNFMTYGFFHGDVVSHVRNFLDVGLYRKAMAVFGALPFAANFAEEWGNGATMQIASRKGIISYAAANVIFCAVYAIVTVFAGMMIFCGIYSLFVPVYEPAGNPYGFIFGQFLKNGHGEIFLTLRIFIFSVSCAMWSILGMLISAIFPNKYVAICAPFVASYVIERITIQFPSNLNLWYLSLSFVAFENDLLGFIYCVGIFAVISATCGIAFANLVRKRVQNEIN